MEINNQIQLNKAKDLIRKEVLRALAEHNSEHSFKYDSYSDKWEIRYGTMLYGYRHGVIMLLEYPDYKVFEDYTNNMVHKLLMALKEEEEDDNEQA